MWGGGGGGGGNRLSTLARLMQSLLLLLNKRVGWVIKVWLWEDNSLHVCMGEQRRLTESYTDCDGIEAGLGI